MRRAIPSATLSTALLLAFFAQAQMASIQRQPHPLSGDSGCSMDLKRDPKSPSTAPIYTPQCSPYALGGYRDGTHNRCFVTIDRSAPVSPQTITVPPGTTVCVALINTRPTESVQFVPSFANISANDAIGSFVQSLSPLQSVGFAGGIVQAPFAAEAELGLVPPPPVDPLTQATDDFLKLSTHERVRVFSVINGATGKDLLAASGQPTLLLTADKDNTGDAQKVVDVFKQFDQPAFDSLSKSIKTVSLVRNFAIATATQKGSVQSDFDKPVADAKTKAGANWGNDQSLVDADAASQELKAQLKKLDEDKLLRTIFKLSDTWLATFENLVVKYCPPPSTLPAAVGKKLDDIEQKLNSAQVTITNANTAANCFAQYNKTLSSATEFINFNGGPQSSERQAGICDLQLLNEQGTALQGDLQSIYNSVSAAVSLPLPQGQITYLSTIITDGLKQCSQQTESSLSISPAGGGGNPTTGSNPSKAISHKDCETLKAYNDRLTALQAIATNLATSQTSLVQVKLQMDTIPTNMDWFVYKLPIDGRNQKGYTSGTISIVTQPLVSTGSTPTPTTIASVPITFGAGRWRTFATSTGTSFMLGRAANYSLQQQATVATNNPAGSGSGTLCSGTATSSSGSASTYCVVDSPSSSPQILVPTVFAHYLLFGAQKTPFQVGVHLTGGVGLDVSPANKSAAFLTGASLQLGSVMITPAVTFFEDQRLGGGYSVGQLYTSSGGLPTNEVWVKKFSIGISYVIPPLSSASPASPASSPTASPGGSSTPAGQQSPSGGGSPRKPH